jgi:hypothetical protein
MLGFCLVGYWMMGAFLWFALVWFAALSVWCRQIRMPHTIEISDTGLVRFIGAFRDLTIPAQDITEVKGRGSYVLLRHAKGTVVFLRDFTEFYKMLADLTRSNGKIKVRGV